MNQTHTMTEAAFQASPVAQAILTSELDLVFWNSKFEKMAGRICPGDSFESLFHEKSHREMAKLLNASLNLPMQEMHLLLCLSAKSDCESEVIVTITELSENSVDGQLLVTLHPLNRAEAGDAIRRQREELEHLVEERTEALQRTNKELEMFSYSVSHDLRSPLRSVLGFSSALEEDYADIIGAEGKDYLKRISAAAHRMDALITSILAVSRISRAAVQVSEVDLSELATSFIPEVLRSNPRAKIRVQPGLVVKADPALLRVVVANLLDNAAKFSSRADDPVIEIGIAADMPGHPVYVRDNGIGFEEQYTEKIFEPFERLYPDSEFPGTGIGLSNVRRVIERHKGKVWAVGDPGKGATFFFTLSA